ncbi:hypothetical protein UA08_06133 [Talaromyces atroroseus]|uniref:Something about silencing protein 4 domain-containing protein n=1 Tax=Talaromyces atroroseus TaxID=1441469 RepID=A0A225ATU4_TALAT|nr:hypothetical protein UA08_06133 [Talaromyces atroroseus]OKL58356.1 hypothetical protein UA08_06133 [Talaromyces atroroseus]
MVGASRLSIRDDEHSPSSGDHDDHEMQQKKRTRTTTIRTSTTPAASTSLPNLVVRAKNPASTSTSTSATKKRPRLSASSSSPPASPHPRHQHTPRRPPKRAPLTTSQQQTTLDKFFGAGSHNGVGARKDNTIHSIRHIGSQADEARPAKKARLDTIDADTHSIGAREESPDPLNAISPMPNTASVRKHTRQPRAGKTVIIADDKATTQTIAARQPAAAEKRSLRSHNGGSRSKSELALYFPNYEQIISLEPVKSDEFLLPGTVVTLLDDLVASPPTASPSSRTRKTQPKKDSSDQVSPFGNPLLDLRNVEKVDIPSLAGGDDRNAAAAALIDPLGDDVYFKAHRRHERQEKQLRNIERERAQHEKIQLDRLLDELQGHDWLRVMGISGITDTEKKLYEPKRDYFVKEVCALIDKFRVWKEEEKRRKLQRERMLLEAATAAVDEEEEEVDDGDDEEEEEEEEDIKPPSSDIQSFDSNEVDAAAARQLILEARSANTNNSEIASTPPKAHSQPRRRLVDALTATPPKAQPQQTPEILLEEEEDDNKPFVSFYPKRHLRDAAFSSSRRGGRNRSAFGQPLPDIVEEREFELPRDILTPELVHAMERKRRRLKRESRSG